MAVLGLPYPLYFKMIFFILVCALALHSKYAKYATDGFTALYTRPPVIYISGAAPPDFGKTLRNRVCKFRSGVWWPRNVTKLSKIDHPITYGLYLQPEKGFLKVLLGFSKKVHFTEVTVDY